MITDGKEKKSKWENKNASAATVTKRDDYGPLQIVNSLLNNICKKNSLCEEKENNEEEYTKMTLGQHQKWQQPHPNCWQHILDRCLPLPSDFLFLSSFPLEDDEEEDRRHDYSFANSFLSQSSSWKNMMTMISVLQHPSIKLTDNFLEQFLVETTASSTTAPFNSSSSHKSSNCNSIIIIIIIIINNNNNNSFPFTFLSPTISLGRKALYNDFLLLLRLPCSINLLKKSIDYLFKLLSLKQHIMSLFLLCYGNRCCYCHHYHHHFFYFFRFYIIFDSSAKKSTF